MTSLSPVPVEPLFGRPRDLCPDASFFYVHIHERFRSNRTSGKWSKKGNGRTDPGDFSHLQLSIQLSHLHQYIGHLSDLNGSCPFIKKFLCTRVVDPYLSNCVGSTAETNCDLDPTYPKINPVCAHGKGASINHMTLLRGGGGQLESQRGVIRGGVGQWECHMTIYVTFCKKICILEKYNFYIVSQFFQFFFLNPIHFQNY